MTLVMLLIGLTVLQSVSIGTYANSRKSFVENVTCSFYIETVLHSLHPYALYTCLSQKKTIYAGWSKIPRLYYNTSSGRAGGYNVYIEAKVETGAARELHN